MRRVEQKFADSELMRSRLNRENARLCDELEKRENETVALRKQLDEARKAQNASVSGGGASSSRMGVGVGQ
ncbi:unnamed protein product, partial [Amoebophrya sp. A25]|eukprot:GSA25T00020260001.1